MDAKFETILNYTPERAKERFREADRFTYPLIMCLSDKEISQFYLENYSNCLERKIIGIIIKRIEEHGPSPFYPLLDAILALLNQVDNKRFRRLIAHIKRFAPHFGRDVQSNLFYRFIDDDRISVRRISYLVATNIWGSKVEKYILKAWNEHRDQYVLKLLIAHNVHSPLFERLADIWDDDGIDRRAKHNLMKLAAEHDFSLISFLRVSAPLTYMFFAQSLGHEVAGEEIFHIVMKCEDDSTIGFGLWLLGRMKNWNLIIELSEEKYDLKGQDSGLTVSSRGTPQKARCPST